MQDLLNQYQVAKLAKYAKTMPAREAMIAAQFALDDMKNSVRGYKRDCGYTDSQVCEVLKMEIEDCERAGA